MKKFIFCSLFIFILLTFASVSWGQTLDITLTWSSDTYVPAGYPGQALPSRDSIVEIIANLDSNPTNLINPSKLIYNWYLNGDLQKKDSGEGKQTFRFNVGKIINQTHYVEARVSDSEGIDTGRSRRLPIKIAEPQIVISLLRPRSELLQISDLLTNKFQISAGREIKFIARPYFFNISQPEELNYKWEFDEKEIYQSENKNPDIFNLKIGEVAGSITRSLNLFVENKSNFIQRAQTKVEITLNP